MKNRPFSSTRTKFTTISFGSRIGFKERLTSFIVLSAFILPLLIPIDLYAQSVPQLTKTKNFSGSDLQPYVDAAKQQTDEAGFMNILRGGENAIEASWEAEVEAEINGILGGVTSNDKVNDVTVYREAVRAQLQLQKQQAKAGWLADATAFIQSELNSFLNYISTKKDQNIEASKSSLVSSINPTVSQVAAMASASQEASPSQVTQDYKTGAAVWDSKWQDLQTKKANWEQDSLAAIQNGILQWNTTISNLVQEKQDYLDGIALTKSQWIQNQQYIDNAETALRNSLQQTVTNIQSQRAQMGASFLGNPVMSASFGDIDALLASIQQKLDDRASVSSMAETLGTFFRNQENYAKDKGDEWNVLKWENVTVSQSLTFNRDIGNASITCSTGNTSPTCYNLPTQSRTLYYQADGSLLEYNAYTYVDQNDKNGYRVNAALSSSYKSNPSNTDHYYNGHHEQFKYVCNGVEIGGTCNFGTGGFNGGGDTCSGWAFCGYSRARNTYTDFSLSVSNNYNQSQITTNNNIRNSINGGYNATFNATNAQGYLAGTEQVISNSTQVFAGSLNITGSGNWYDQIGAYNTVSIFTDYRYIDSDKQANENTWRGYQSNYKSLADNFLSLVNPLKDWEDRSKQYKDEYDISLVNLESAKTEAITNIDAQIASLKLQRDTWITDVYGYQVAGTGAVDNVNSRFRAGSRTWDETITTFKSVELNWFLTAKDALNQAIEGNTGEKKFQSDVISAVNDIKDQIVSSNSVTTQLYTNSQNLWKNYQYNNSGLLMDQAVIGKANEISLGETGATLSQKLIDSYARTEAYATSEMDATVRIQNILGMFSQPGYDVSEFDSVQANIDSSAQGQTDWGMELNGGGGKFGFIPRANGDRNTLALYKDVRDDSKKATALQNTVIEKENKLLSQVEEYFKKADTFLTLAKEYEEKGKFDEATYYTQQAINKKAEASVIIKDGYKDIGDFMLTGITSSTLTHTKPSFLSYKDALIGKSYNDSQDIANQIKDGKNKIAGINSSSDAYDQIQGLLATSQSLIARGVDSQNLANQLISQSRDLGAKNLKGELLDGLEEMIAAIESGAPDVVSDGSEIASAIEQSNKELKETREKVDGLLSHMNSLVTNENDMKNLQTLLEGSGQALNFAANSAIAKYLDEYSQQFIEENEKRSASFKKEMFQKVTEGPEYAYLREAGYEFRIQGDYIVGSRTIYSGDFAIFGNAMQQESYSPMFMSQNLEINTKFDPGTLRVDTLSIDSLMTTEFSANQVKQVAGYVENMASNMEAMFAQFSDKTAEVRSYSNQNDEIKEQNIETYKKLSSSFLSTFQALEGNLKQSYNPNMTGLRDNYKQSQYNFGNGSLSAKYSPGEAWRSINSLKGSEQRHLGERELKGTVNIKGIPIEVKYGEQYLNVPTSFSISNMGYNFNLKGYGTNYASSELAQANGAFSNYLDGTIKDIQAISKANDEEKESKGFLFDVLSGTSSGASVAQSFKSVVKERVNGMITSSIAEATGLPSGLVSALVGGKSMKDAVKEYAKQEATNAISQATGIPAWAISQQLDKMSKPKEKFYETSTFKTVVAVAAVVAAPFTGGASLVALAAMGAVQGAASGGLQGAVVGAIGGVANGFVAGATGGTVNVGLSYDSTNGFGASVGLTGGVASVSISERGGVSASVGIAGVAKVGVSYSKDQGFGVSASLAIGAVQAGVGYTQKSGASVALGVKTENGLTAGVTYSKNDGFGATVGATTGNYSGGLSYNKNEGIGAFASQNNFNKNGSIGSTNSLTFNQRDGVGVERTTNSASGSSTTLGITQNGGLSAEYSSANGYSVSAGYNLNTGTYNVGVSIEKKSGGEKPEDVVNLGRTNINFDSESGLSTSSDPVNDSSRVNIKQGIATSQAELRGSLETQAVGVKAKYQELDDAKKKWLAANGGSTEGWDDLSDEEKETRVQNKSGELMGTGARDQHTTRDNILERAWGNVKDFGSQMVGNYADHSGEMTYDKDGKPSGFKDRTCFVAGTKIHTSLGLKNIEDIQVGDLVLSKSDETGEVAYKKVVNTFVRQTDAIYRVRFTDGTLLETTWNHPFRVLKADAKGQSFSIENTQWKEAKDLLPGDVSLSADGASLQLLSVEIDQREETVYNFEVEDFHTYFVGEVGIWVHNAAYLIIPMVVGAGIRACATNPACTRAVSTGVAITGAIIGGIFDKPNINLAEEGGEKTKKGSPKLVGGEEKLPNQGQVTAGVEGAPVVNAGDQGKHLIDHNNGKQNPNKTKWKPGENGVKETQEAWLNGRPVKPDGSVKVGNSSDGRNIKVHINGDGEIHGYPIP